MLKALSGILGIITSTSAIAASLSPTMIRKEIKISGPQAVVNRLFKSGYYEKTLIKRIKSGNAEWVSLARPISKGTDAASSEELSQALVYALPISPKAVLSIIDLTGSSVPRSLQAVCSASFYEGDPTNIPKYLAAAKNAVKSVSDPRLNKVRRGCLAKLSKL